MEIYQKNISELIPYEKNPRKNDNAVQAVANSIKEFGFKVPIVIDNDNVIVAGHTRLNAMNSTHSRLHHEISWNHCVPRIISGRWKKI